MRIFVPFLAALLMVGGARPASAQRRTESASFTWGTRGPWQVKFTPATAGEMTIVIKWKSTSSAMGQAVPRQWGIKLMREAPLSSSTMTQPLPHVLASTAGDVSGLVTLRYNVTTADLSLPNAWLAAPTGGPGAIAQDFELLMSVTYPLPATQAPIDLALVSVESQLDASRRPAMLYAHVKNVGKQNITITPGVECRLKSFRFRGSVNVYSSTPWVPGKTMRVQLEQRPQENSLYPGSDTAHIDPGMNVIAGPHNATCAISTHPPEMDYYPDNDTLQTQVMVPPAAAPKLTLDVSVDGCNGKYALIAGQPACAHLSWESIGGGFDGGFTTTCMQGGQRSVITKAGRTRGGDKGRSDFDPGSMATGPHVMICKLETATGFTVQSVDTILVKPPQRSDLALAAIGRVVHTASGQSRITVWLQNAGTVESGSNAVDCVIAGHRFTNPYGFARAGTSEKMWVSNPQSLTSFPEGVHQATCSVTVGGTSAADINPANNTISGPVRIAHPGHEPYVDIRHAATSLEISHDYHDILGQDASTINETMLRVTLEVVLGAAPRAPLLLVCLKDETGADLSSYISSASVLSGNVIVGNTTYMFTQPIGRVTWTDPTTAPPARGIVHVEAWDSASAAAADGGCLATADPLASPVALPGTGLWSMAEFPATFEWRLPDNFTQKSPLDRMGVVKMSSRKPPRAGDRINRKKPPSPPVASVDSAATSGVEAIPSRAATGEFRITLPSGPVSGDASFICQLTETTSQIAIILGGDGILGGITGKVRRIGPGTYEIMEDEERGIVVAVARLRLPVASYPASSGTLTITEWTRKVIRGSFVYRGKTEDIEGITREHSVSGSFAAVPTPGC